MIYLNSNQSIFVYSFFIFKRREQSRRDDLLALGYMFYHFISGGNLPWAVARNENNKIRYGYVLNLKETIDLSMTEYGLPREIDLYARYTSN